MVEVIYTNDEIKIFRTIEELKKQEKIKLSTGRIKEQIRGNILTGKLTTEVERIGILRIIWTNRENKIYIYDYREKYDPIYWDIIDFSK